MPSSDPGERLIVALDTATATDARQLAARLQPPARFFKIGLGLLATGGLELAGELREAGSRVFLDLKLFDIPSTVRRAVRDIARRLSPDLLTVHGDPHVVEAAAAASTGSSTRILAVTVLSSMDRDRLAAAMMPPIDIVELAVERGRRAMAAGAAGLVAAPSELTALRSDPVTSSALLVAPGIRPAGFDPADQARTATPAEAIAAGADHIVAGRPILQAADPAAALLELLAEIGRNS